MRFEASTAPAMSRIDLVGMAALGGRVSLAKPAAAANEEEGKENESGVADAGSKA